MMNIYILKSVLSFAASLLHCVGFWALWNVKQSNPYMITQRLYLLHLSLAENFHSFFLGIWYINTLFENPRWANYAFICAGGGAFLWYLSIMIMLTIDRFLMVYLDVRYLVYWNVRKTKLVLGICLGVSVIANVIFLVSLPTFNQSLKVFSVYLWFPVDNGFIFIAVVTYAYIFKRVYQPTNKNETKARAYTIDSTNASSDHVIHHDVIADDQQRRLASRTMTQKSSHKFPMKTFMIPLLLITTFILFIGFPDNTYFWYFCLDKEVPQALETLFYIFYPSGIMSDAIIYVLFAKDVRTYLFKKLGLVKQRARGDSQATVTTSDYNV
ncbi:uncharacterized protein [Clytia hemisphaerica]|uniref:uncharacterized protein n=1 Tax=Clytia hemisphaerica TaxID=252671 RepID=UPI0034D42E21